MSKKFFYQPAYERPIGRAGAAGACRSDREAKAVFGDDAVPLETFFEDFGPDAKPLDYLARSIEFLAKADVAVFAPGWEYARGCRIERQCAEEYGIPVMEV
jgi:hypothetical protein